MTDDFLKEMILFAQDLREKARQPNTPLEESINAFKALTAFYAILWKHKPSSSDEEDTTTFDDLQNEVNEVVQQEAANGRTAQAVRNRSG